MEIKQRKKTRQHQNHSLGWSSTGLIIFLSRNSKCLRLRSVLSYNEKLYTTIIIKKTWRSLNNSVPLRWLPTPQEMWYCPQMDAMLLLKWTWQEERWKIEDAFLQWFKCTSIPPQFVKLIQKNQIRRIISEKMDSDTADRMLFRFSLFIHTCNLPPDVQYLLFFSLSNEDSRTRLNAHSVFPISCVLQQMKSSGITVYY